ncbi:MAG: sulfatase [Planctomycetota bacterium]
MTLRYALLLASIVLHTCLVAPADTATNRPPNVILFLVDDMGWTDGGVFGSEYYETPNIDAFAEQSMRFTNAYAHPLCSPSRASILTGQEESRHGILSAHGHLEPEPWGKQVYQSATAQNEYLLTKSRRYLDPDATTLAEVFLGAGYRTAHLGKWHLGLTQEHWPDQHGFEVTFHAAPDPGPPGSTYFSPHGVHPDGKPTGNHRVGNITDGPPGEHIDDRLATEAIRFITEHRDEPFYLNLWMYDCHGPWEAKLDLIQSFAQKHSQPDGHTNPVYGAMLQTMDDNFGRILDALEELGIADNTIVIFFSDNGGNTHSMGKKEQERNLANPKHRAHGYTKIYNRYAGIQYPTKNLGLRAGKGTLYEGGERVPLLIRWTDHIPEGSVSDAIINNIDLYPTLLELTGQPKPDHHVLDGKSFVSVLTGNDEGADRTSVSYFPYHGGGISVRSGDWKLIRRYTRKPDSYKGLVELFNLKDDLGESTNLVDEMPNKVAELSKLIDEHFEQTGGLSPQPNPGFQRRTIGSSKSNSPTHGLVPKQSRIESIDGAIRVVAEGKTPFLGTAQVKVEGPITLELQARGIDGKSGQGRVQWRTKGQEQFPTSRQNTPFEIPASTNWQKIIVKVPVVGRTQVLRLHVPAVDGLEIRTIRWKAENEPTVEWDFSKND